MIGLAQPVGGSGAPREQCVLVGQAEEAQQQQQRQRQQQRWWHQQTWSQRAIQLVLLAWMSMMVFFVTTDTGDTRRRWWWHGQSVVGAVGCVLFDGSSTALSKLAAKLGREAAG